MLGIDEQDDVVAVFFDGDIFHGSAFSFLGLVTTKIPATKIVWCWVDTPGSFLTDLGILVLDCLVEIIFISFEGVRFFLTDEFNGIRFEFFSDEVSAGVAQFDFEEEFGLMGFHVHSPGLHNAEIVLVLAHSAVGVIGAISFDEWVTLALVAHGYIPSSSLSSSLMDRAFSPR